MKDLENQVAQQMLRKQEIDGLPDGERYTARQRWMEDSIELLLLCALDMNRQLLSDRR